MLGSCQTICFCHIESFRFFDVTVCDRLLNYRSHLAGIMNTPKVKLTYNNVKCECYL